MIPNIGAEIFKGYAITVAIGATGGLIVYLAPAVGAVVLPATPEALSITGEGTGVAVDAAAVTATAETAAAETTALEDLAVGEINREVIVDVQRELLKGFLGRAMKGALERAKDFQIPEGLTRETLEAAREIALRAIESGKDSGGVQAVRLELIEKALKLLKGK